MITALWERSVSKQKVDSLNSPSDSGMKFEKGGPRERGNSVYRLGENTSLTLSEDPKHDFGVYLGGNWRFELEADSRSGECLGISGFMSKLTAKRAVLEIPDAESRKLICRSDRLIPGKACYSDSPANSVHYDPRNKILCIGDPEATGDAAEFCDKTVAVISGGKLMSVYLALDGVETDPENGNTLTNCIVLV